MPVAVYQCRAPLVVAFGTLLATELRLRGSSDGVRACGVVDTDRGVGASDGTGGLDALRRCNVLMGNLVRHVEQTGTGWQKIDRQTEQTKPISTIVLWQKHAARKSILSCVGTARIFRIEGGERNDIIKY